MAPAFHSNWAYAAFFCFAHIFAHLARCAAAIFLRADADYGEPGLSLPELIARRVPSRNP